MVSRLISIGAAALVLLLVMGAIMQVAPVLAGITPTTTAPPTATATAAPPTATATAAPPTATATAGLPTATAPTGTPPATPPPFLPNTGGEADGLRSVGNIVVALAGALLLLLGAIIHVLVRIR